MGKRIIIIACILLAVAGIVPTSAQTYSTLWKSVRDARDKDLPRTEMAALGKIVEKADKEKAYGHLLKAQLLTVTLNRSLSPDSAEAENAKIKRLYADAKDKTLKAVYATVLYKIVKDSRDSKDLSDLKSAALADIDLLAKIPADGFSPMVIDGKDSEIFGDDMLSVIGFATDQYERLYDFYHKHGNRRAACVCALYAIKERMDGENGMLIRKSPIIAALDTLTNTYGDLDVAGEVAVERYNFMARCNDVTTEDRIAYINLALDRWGTWQRASELRNAQKQLTASTFNISVGKEIIEPDKAQTVRIERLRNIDELNFNVYPTTLDANFKYSPQHASGYKYVKPYVAQTPVVSISRKYVAHRDHVFFDDSLQLVGLPVGVYMMEATTVPQTQTIRRLYYVTEVGVMSIALPDNKQRLIAVNTTTGQPLSGAQIEIAYNSDSEDTPHTIVATDANGEAVIDMGKKSIGGLRAFTSDDTSSPMRYVNGWFNVAGRNTATEKTYTSIFTDRSIYRPGQTVHASAVIYRKVSSTDFEVVKGETVEAVVRDGNGREIAKKTVVTDEFGACNVDFTLPQSLLNGSVRIAVNGTPRYVRVESYKRPTFTVEFPKVNERYAAGDTIVVKAQAVSYAGVPVQGAKVTYSVERHSSFWWAQRSGYLGKRRVQGNEQVFQGEVTTDDTGHFDITMPLSLPDAADGFFEFTANVTVTDQGGETQSAELSVPLGTKATAFGADIPEKALADSLRTITFNLYNSSGVDIHADVKYRIDGGEWLTAKTTEPTAIAKLSTGMHEIYAVCETDTLTRRVVVFNLDDTTPAANTADWFYVSKFAFPQDGRPVTLQVGTSASNTHIVYAILSGDSVLESGFADIDNQLINRKLTYKKEYGDGILLCYAWMKDGEFHSHSARITRPVRPDNLRLEWATFRDRLRPGDSEEWTLRITDPDGKPARAQLAATMYDKSLDQLAAHSLGIHKNVSLGIPSTAWRHATANGIFANGYRRFTSLSYQRLAFSHFDDDIYPFFTGYGELLSAREIVPQTRTSYRMLKAKETAYGIDHAANAVIAYDANGNDAAVDESIVEEAKATTENNGGDASVQLRENMNETAFFMPQLLADSTGTVSLKFTLPESLTTWRLLGVAHTQDMMTGTIEADVVANKDLMVLPNMPRFVRSGDKVTIVSRIFNKIDTPLSGKAEMTLIDPRTEFQILKSDMKFSVESSGTTTVQFSFDAPTDCDLLVCRIVAEGNGFSDGEQHYLPVLPDSERIIVTVPFTMHEAGTFAVDIDKLFPTKGDKRNRLTVEYTENPAWLALQSLPQLSSPIDDNAVSLASSIYANAIGRKILSEAPTEVKATFEQWRTLGDDTSLTSNLAKNDDLKDIILSETPWLAEADNETETKRRMGEFMDDTAIDYRISTAAQKLGKLQMGDNLWSWWKGMQGRAHVTVEIVKMMARLEAMGISVDELKYDIEGARRALDRQIEKLVKKMKQEEAKGHKQSFPSGIALDYLYINAIAPKTLSASTKAANSYLLEKLRKEIRTQDIGDKAMTAIILEAAGDHTAALEYAHSLKEHTVYTDEKGRYYDTRRAAYSWCDHRIPTQVAAMEALSRITPADTKTLDEMRRWLLMQKRTQSWSTPINSVNAVSALLNDLSVLKAPNIPKGSSDPNVLKAPNVPITLSLDGKPIDTPASTLGIGYVKTSIDNPKAKTFAAEKTDDGTSWGAVYVQYMQKASDVATSASGLSIRRELIDADGNVLSPASQLKVGDKITVRLTIKADRDFDFVSVIDRRAACMEPIAQFSGYANGHYTSPKDNATYYHYDILSKGVHTVETSYRIDRTGVYETGTASVQCAYAPEYKATVPATIINVF